MPRIIFNNEEIVVAAPRLTWEAACELAGVPHASVTYHKGGGHGGTIHAGKSVELVDGMVVNAIPTGKG